MEKTILENHSTPTLETEQYKITYFKDYKIVSLLKNSGAESDVFLLEKEEDKKFILKLFRTGITAPVETYKKLNDINSVPTIYEWGTEEGTNREYVIMEYIAGSNLNKLINQINTIKLASKISEILNELHQKDIYHLDLKPNNIIIEKLEPLELKLIDFGMSSLIEDSMSKKLTNIKGTKEYQSPEMALGLATSKADYWSLGIILHKKLCGEMPVINYYNYDVEISECIEEKYKFLLKKFLTKIPDERWAHKEFKNWIDEKFPIPKKNGISQDKSAISLKEGFKYEGQKFYSLDELVKHLHKTNSDSTDGFNKFKKIVFRGYLDSYLGEEYMSEYKTSLIALSDLFYDYNKNVKIFNPKSNDFLENSISTKKYFKYNNRFFQSLEELVLFLHTIEDGLKIFKTLVYSIKLDKYFSEDFNHARTSPNYLNTLFYQYGKKNQSYKFEDKYLNAMSLWFKINKDIHNNYSSISKSNHYNKLLEIIDLVAVNEDEADINISFLTNTCKNYRKVKGHIFYEIDMIKDIISLDQSMAYFKIIGVYNEIITLPKNEITPYLVYKYMSNDFLVNGLPAKNFKEIAHNLDNHWWELKYHLRFKRRSILGITKIFKNQIKTLLIKEENILKKVIFNKENLILTQSALKLGFDEQTVNDIWVYEKNNDFLDYFYFITTKFLIEEMPNIKKKKEGIFILLKELRDEKKEIFWYLNNFSYYQLMELYTFHLNNESLELKKFIKTNTTLELSDSDFVQLESSNSTKEFLSALLSYVYLYHKKDNNSSKGINIFKILKNKLIFSSKSQKI